MTFIVMQLYTFLNVFMGFYQYKNHKSNKILLTNKDETRKLSKVFCGAGGNNTKEKASEEFESVWRLRGEKLLSTFARQQRGERDVTNDSKCPVVPRTDTSALCWRLRNGCKLRGRSRRT